MDKIKEVSHTGIIGKIDKQGIKVTVGVIAGCANCQINGNCDMAEQSVKELFIECDSSQYKTGQRVEVRLKAARGMNSIFLLYIPPAIILLFTMLIASVFIKDENTIGIVSLLSLLPYYLIILIFRNRIKKQMKYIVIPIYE
jgi:positive regulator of sigma E activity